MTIEKTKTQLIELIDNEYVRVIALSGKWGVGKTHLWEQIQRDSTDENIHRSLYVSLFGLSSVEQIKRKLMEVAIPAADEHGGTFDLIKNVIKVGFNAASEHYKALASLSDLNVVLMAPILLREKLIVIDDIERKHEDLGIDEVLGFIHEYSMQFKVRFLLILNDDQLSTRGDQEKIWSTFREKVIDNEVRLSTTPDEAFTIASKTWRSNYNPALKRAVITCGLTNIRVIGKVIKTANQILAGHGLAESIQGRVVPSIVLFSAIHFRALEDGPDFQFALNIANQGRSMLARANNGDLADQEFRENRWRLLMSELGINGCDEFEKLLVEFLESGLFEDEQVKSIIERYIDEEHQMKIRQSARDFIQKAIWDHRANEADLVSAAAMFSGVNASHLDAYLATELYEVLSELEGGKSLADEIIKAWIDQFQASGRSAPSHDNPFNNPLHPDIKLLFDTEISNFYRQISVVEACNYIFENGAWGTMQEVAIKRATVDDFKMAIQEMDIEELPRFMRRMIQMRLQKSTYDVHFGLASSRFVEACRNLANDQSGKAKRLSKLLKRIFSTTAIAAELNLPKALP